ncbi:hypothetical protein SESBI_09582 [Sesbania bispinosa]|nr:hypothetical protein SESBI_09582 [Sesbania bispinosa]
MNTRRKSARAPQMIMYALKALTFCFVETNDKKKCRNYLPEKLSSTTSRYRSPKVVGEYSGNG